MKPNESQPVAFDTARDALINDKGEVICTGEFLRTALNIAAQQPQKGLSDDDMRKIAAKIQEQQRSQLRLGLSAQFLNTLLTLHEGYQGVEPKIDQAVDAADGLIQKLNL